MCLSEIRRGQTVRIEKITDETIRTQFLRFGIQEGSIITCLEKIPFGPFMLRHNRQEIAIGRKVAQHIIVQ